MIGTSYHGVNATMELEEVADHIKSSSGRVYSVDLVGETATDLGDGRRWRCSAIWYNHKDGNFYGVCHNSKVNKGSSTPQLVVLNSHNKWTRSLRSTEIF